MPFKSLYFALALTVLIILSILYYHFNPAEYRFFPRCPFHTLTGFDCPGCGSQRAVYHLLHLNVFAALRDNLLLVASVPLLLVQSGYKLKSAWYQKDIRWNLIYHPLMPKVIFAVVMLFWILRNIPLAPFNYLSANH